jgi:hypothetical protein
MKSNSKKKSLVSVKIANVPIRNVEEIKKRIGDFMAKQMQKRLI